MASILITGTSRGIGLETALAFGRAGHKYTRQCAVQGDRHNLQKKPR